MPVSALAQDAQPTDSSIDQQQEENEENVIVVTGSNIVGAQINEALPVTVFSTADIDSFGIVDGDDIIRTLPSQGGIDFRNDNSDTVNDARGDVSSINLRSIGPGNTLVLLNGRRMVNHPGTQTVNLVPAVTVNTNALPVAGISRVEVLNDGASAIYGSDAVAGVFNTILRKDFEGLDLTYRQGLAENTDSHEEIITMQAGHTFNDGRTNISFSGRYSHRRGVFASELPFSRTEDLRPLVEGTSFEGDTSFDNRSTRSPWGQFTLNTSSANRVRQNGDTLTSTSGVFHIQPNSFAGCRGSTATDLATPGVCIDDGSLDRDLRHDGATVDQLLSNRDRINAFLFLNHELSDSIDLYGEFGYYWAETRQLLQQNTSIASGDIVIPANNYWNPFGPVRFSNGELNPNRLPGLTNVPDEGLPVFVDGARFRLVDVGPRRIKVTNNSWRALLGLKGTFGADWNWDTAALYSRARTLDKTANRVSSTLFQEALSNETPSAYNMFNGADPNNPSFDITLNPQSVIDPFLIDVRRESKTELALADFKVSNGSLIELPAGGLGVAAGVEFRYEGYSEDRDDRLDGTITFTQAVTGDVIGSDVMGSSPTSDSSGSREVYSGFVEVSLPAISPEMNVPLIYQLDFQAAGRYEEYSDIGGSGFKPRFAAGWKPFEFIKFRASYSEGFRAPNLLTINEQGVARSNTRTDNIYCEAGVRNGTFATFADCDGFTESREEQRAGNPDLNPEDNRSYTLGLVLEPRELSGFASFLNNLTFTVDFWDIKQQNVVGIFGGGNHLDLDYALRVNGDFNPAVVRAAPTADQINFFAGTGIAAAGDILFIQDTYLNLQPRRIKGTDFGLYYRLRNTPAGDFNFKINVAHLRRFEIIPSESDQFVLDQIASGNIDPSVTISNAGSIIQQDGQPKWRGSGSFTWRHDSGIGLGVSGIYVGPYTDTAPGLDPDGNPFRVDDWLVFNGYVQYAFPESAAFLKNSRIRFGINNITDKDPPLADSSYGYDGSYHSATGRYYYFDFQLGF